MVARLDDLLTMLKELPSEPRLAGLEPQVWARIDAIRRTGPLPLTWRVGTASLALTLGAAIGGVGASAAIPVDLMAAFSPQAALAPSTLFEGGW